jgi:outer membrane protein OmpA-like peptidoglycan-associated protein
MMNRQLAPTPAPAPPPAAINPTSPAPTADAHLSLASDNGHVTYSGTVRSAAEQDQIVNALKAAYGDANVSGDIKVDANTKPAAWLSALGGFLPDFKANGAHLDFDGNNVSLSGGLSDADKTSLSDRLRAAFGSFNLSGLQAVKVDAASALSALEPGKFSADDLVKALNLMIIHFNTGSAAISADSLDILGKAATALKAAPAGTKVEVGGHTDNVGNADMNLKLSDARANAVRAKLVELGVAADALTAKGYGDSKPVADNATDEGRARNRRIEFTLQP